MARILQRDAYKTITCCLHDMRSAMDTWTKLTEFFACGLAVLPATLGYGFDSFEVFAVTLAIMLLLLIGFTIGAPAVQPAPAKNDSDKKAR